MGTPSAQTLDDVGVREIFEELEEGLYKERCNC
jgi:hypothetical protein